jgi:hypothetical protein
MKHLLFSSILYVFIFPVFAKQNSTPESTLREYLSCFETSDEQCVLNNYYGINSFNTGKPYKTDFKITKKVVFGSKEVKLWNDAGIVPKAFKGDVSLDVLQTSNDKESMYSYNFRRYDNKWLIYSHSAWGLE